MCLWPAKQEAQAHAARVEADNAKRLIEAERLAVEQANFQKVRALLEISSCLEALININNAPILDCQRKGWS
jgi:hypothetical protein